MEEFEPDDNPVISDEEWENRTLCTDGSCIGVIGPDGFCKECGRPGPDKPMSSTPASQSHDNSIESEDETPDDKLNEEEIISDEEWENRKLCSDGSCIGVIGPDGLCKECGRPCDEDDPD